jgi:hypothetical protein
MAGKTKAGADVANRPMHSSSLIYLSKPGLGTINAAGCGNRRQLRRFLGLIYGYEEFLCSQVPKAGPGAPGHGSFTASQFACFCAGALKKSFILISLEVAPQFHRQEQKKRNRAQKVIETNPGWACNERVRPLFPIHQFAPTEGYSLHKNWEGRVHRCADGTRRSLQGMTASALLYLRL